MRRHLRAILLGFLLAFALSACEPEDPQEDGADDDLCFELTIDDGLPRGFEYWEFPCASVGEQKESGVQP